MQETLLNSRKRLPLLRAPDASARNRTIELEAFGSGFLGLFGYRAGRGGHRSVDVVVIGMTNQGSATVSDGFVSDSPADSRASKYSIVSVSPSLSPTFGDQSSFSLASRRSGLRRIGSFLGT